MNAVELYVASVKCDADGCNFDEPCVSAIESYLDRPCPKCGASLLTAKDLAAINWMKASAEYINSQVGPVERSDAKRPVYHIAMDGSGDIDVTGPIEGGAE
jgi:hypothetical protein